MTKWVEEYRGEKKQTKIEKGGRKKKKRETKEKK